jgi:hypothetical protein
MAVLEVRFITQMFLHLEKLVNQQQQKFKKQNKVEYKIIPYSNTEIV